MDRLDVSHGHPKLLQSRVRADRCAKVVWSQRGRMVASYSFFHSTLDMHGRSVRLRGQPKRRQERYHPLRARSKWMQLMPLNHLHGSGYTCESSSESIQVHSGIAVTVEDLQQSPRRRARVIKQRPRSHPAPEPETDLAESGTRSLERAHPLGNAEKERRAGCALCELELVI